MNPGNDIISRKKALILEYEEKFANTLAMQVIEKPKHSLWLILIIPLMVVYHIYEYQKCSKGRKNFAENYMISRKRALDEATAVVRTGKKPDIGALVQIADIPESATEEYARWLAVLADHYTDILRAEARDFDSLVRYAYKNRTNYLLFLNRLNQDEKKLNTALKPHIPETQEVVDSIVSAIELCSENLRRESAERIFGELRIEN